MVGCMMLHGSAASQVGLVLYKFRFAICGSHRRLKHVCVPNKEWTNDQSTLVTSLDCVQSSTPRVFEWLQVGVCG